MTVFYDNIICVTVSGDFNRTVFAQVIYPVGLPADGNEDFFSFCSRGQ